MGYVWVFRMVHVVVYMYICERKLSFAPIVYNVLFIGTWACHPSCMHDWALSQSNSLGPGLWSPSTTRLGRRDAGSAEALRAQRRWGAAALQWRCTASGLSRGGLAPPVAQDWGIQVQVQDWFYQDKMLSRAVVDDYN